MRRFALSVPCALLSLVTSTLVDTVVSAQEPATPFVIGETMELESRILNETRRLIVGKPEGYDTRSDRYPVLVLLDGGAHFHHTTGITKFLAANGRVPEMLVVAVTNTDRTRDLTPPSQVQEDIDLLPTHGGADDFRRFIAEELVPWVEGRYRTAPYRVLVGHSFGGLFAIHTLVTDPTVFDAYIAISPSLQWNDQGLVSGAEAFFEQTAELEARLFMTTGNEGGALLGGVRKLSGVLNEMAPKGFEWAFELMAEESHGSVPHRSTYQGLEFVFADYYLTDVMTTFDERGLEGITDFYTESGKRIGLERRVPLSALGELLGRLIQAERLDEAAMLLAADPETYAQPVPEPLLIQVWTMLAGGYARNNDEERAVEFYRKVTEADPGNEAATRALEDLQLDTVE